VRAVLLDEEAYANPAPPDFTKAHLKHPVLLVTNLLRSMGVRSADGSGLSDGYLNPQNQLMGMDLFVPPSVFSYFSPSNGVPGSTLRGPEFGVLNTSTSVRRSNFVNTMVYSRINTSTNAPSGTSIDLSPLQPLATGNVKFLVEELNQRLLHGTMSFQTLVSIVGAVNAVPASDSLRRVRTAVYLVLTSSQYQVQR